VADPVAKRLWTNGAVFVQHHSCAVTCDLVFLGRTKVDRIIIARVLHGPRRTRLFEPRTVASAELGGSVIMAPARALRIATLVVAPLAAAAGTS